MSDGSVACWGANGDGELGNGSTTDSSVPVAVSGITNAVAIAAGAEHTCALLSDGSVACWGTNNIGYIGVKDTSVPLTVPGITNAIALAAGSYHTCVVLSGGSLACWGHNPRGGLGDGSTTASSAPVAVLGITDAIAIAAGQGHTCAVLSSGVVQCWGYNRYGQLGNGSTADSSVPVTVSGITNAIAVAAGGQDLSNLEHTCAALSDGTVKCWGTRLCGALGDGIQSNGSSSVPVTVSGITNAIAVTAGVAHTCALLGGGLVKCWGWNSDGQIGDGRSGLAKDAWTPVTVNGF